MFYDEVNVHLKAGNGGDGCVSFRRGKYEPKGGPDGGSGGCGGGVYIVADNNVADLTDYYFKPNWKAKNGEPGRGSQQHGANGADILLKLPEGTVVLDRETDEVVAEVLDHGEPLLLLKGGQGGKGNETYKSSTNQTPREFTLGKPGGAGEFRLVVKTIADVGLVGFPNAGKSTLLNMLTNAHPKTGAYPFTTMFPMVGVLEYPDQYERITLADIPGLIEGASENRGLGHRFLKHIERCKVLLILIDMEGTDGREPIADYRILLNELKLYKPALLKKPIFIAANKMDEPNASDNLKVLEKKVKQPVYPISCVSDEGMEGLKKVLLEAVLEMRRAEEEESDSERLNVERRTSKFLNKKHTDLAVQLSKRYAPFADWQSIVDLDSLPLDSKKRYWRTPEEVAALHAGNDLPLKGLRLVLDSGHVGGQWAAHEQREFRIEEKDFYVREAELTLEVVKSVRAELIELGAEVALLREALIPVNSKRPIDYLEEAMEQLPFPDEFTSETFKDYASVLRGKAIRLALVSDELTERARLVNEVIQPDALISVHLNAAAWPDAADDGTISKLQLVDFNDLHVLIFGCMSEGELKSPVQQDCLAAKLNKDSGAVEQLLGGSLAEALAEATELPPATYETRNAVLLDPDEPYVFARNLMILRLAECPTVLLEPYIANSKAVYPRLQSALADRAVGNASAEDDILVEYANAVVAGVLNVYGS